MSPTRVEAELEPIEIDFSMAFSLERGFGRAELLQFGPRLEEARRKTLEATSDAQGFLKRPQQLLFEYHRERNNSTLGQILARAKQLREAVDRVIVLGPLQLIAAAQALCAACGHPHHNDLTRGQRGGRPRIYFAPAVPDNDALQALVDVVPHDRLVHTVDDRWGILALADFHNGSEMSGDGHLLTGLFSLLWDKLQTTAAAVNETELAVIVAPQHSPLRTLAEQIGLARIANDEAPCETYFLACSFFDAGVLTAASVMGLDVVKLLQGAVAMWDRFTAMPPGDNPALDFAGLCCLMAQRLKVHGFRIWPAVSALASLAQNLQSPRGGDDLLVQWIPETVRHDRLSVSMPSTDDGDRKKRKDFLLTELAARQLQTIRENRYAAGEYTVIVKLAAVDEGTIGQLIQLHAISAATQLYLQNPEH
jgi:glucose-6-phosphate isomerase